MARHYLLCGRPMEDDDLLTLAEAATVLGVGPAHAGHLTRTGVIPAGAVLRTPGGSRRYVAGPIVALRERHLAVAP